MVTFWFVFLVLQLSRRERERERERQLKVFWISKLNISNMVGIQTEGSTVNTTNRCSKIAAQGNVLGRCLAQQWPEELWQMYIVRSA